MINRMKFPPKAGYIVRWCCVCGTPYYGVDTPENNSESPVCTLTCLELDANLQISEDLSQWHGDCKKNDVAAAILDYV